MRNAGLDEAQAGIKIAGRNINNLRYADDTSLMAKIKEELKSLLMKVKEESGKVGLKLNIQKTKIMASGPISSVQLLRCVWLFGTPWTTAQQASLSITNSQSLLKLMSIDSVMPSNHLTPSPPALNLSQHQSLFKWVSFSLQVAKVFSFSFNISPSNEHRGLISFRMDWLDHLAVQGTLKSLLQHHSSKASVLRSAFFIVQPSHPRMTAEKKT